MTESDVKPEKERLFSIKFEKVGIHDGPRRPGFIDTEVEDFLISFRERLARHGVVVSITKWDVFVYRVMRPHRRSRASGISGHT